MKNLISGFFSVCFLLLTSMTAFALEVPTNTTVRNLNGIQEYIKVFHVTPETDPASLIEEPFEYNGYVYTYLGMVKEEVPYEDVRSYTETVTVETEKNDLNQILGQLEPSRHYDDGTYSGTLTLDHTSIRTEEAGRETRSYTLTEVKEFPDLPSNDMSYIPQSTEKKGVMLPLKNVDWQVQATALVDDALVPSAYKAVATYASNVSYSAVTGYISLVDYVGEIRCERISEISYTVTYTGTPITSPAPEVTESPAVLAVEETQPPRIMLPENSPAPEMDTAAHAFLENMNWLWFVGAAVAALLLFVMVALIISARKRGVDLNHDDDNNYELEDDDD